ncbi:alkaline phosphatase PhoX [Kaarinaea lacus]
MNRYAVKAIVSSMVLAGAQCATAGTDVYFNPLIQSTAVATPNHINELNSPWQTPAGISQVNLTSLREVEADPNQSIVRVPGLGSNASMFDMVAFDPSGKYVFIPHETGFGAGVTRYSIEEDFAEVLFSGNLDGADGDWSGDFGALDPATWTPHDTLFLGEEWSGEGRIIELMNPMADVNDISYRELHSIPNVAHEGLRFSNDGKTLYFVDEWNSGSLYKFVPKQDDYMQGQSFVLVVDAYDGNPADYWNEESNANSVRTGAATWVPLTDEDGNKLTLADPFVNGPSNDPRSNSDTRGGRPAADEVNGTPYGRPEDMEVGRLKNGHEVIYFSATSERAVYSVEDFGDGTAYVRMMASDANTPKNLGHPVTTAVLNSPDNLAQDALGNIYIIEDAPNSSDVGGDIWFIRDVDNDGVAESLDHFLSIQVDGAEATGMIFNPAKPTQFIVAVQHPDSTDLSKVSDGFGDALWLFDVTDVVAPTCPSKDKDNHYHGKRSAKTCSESGDTNFVKTLKRAAKKRQDND